jgi:hypothetical protein
MPVLAKEPGQAAINFLQKVREGKVNLNAGEDTALSPHITDRKRKLIEESIKNLASQIGEEKLELGEIRQDGDFAAVMVMQDGGADKSKLQVFPVALVKGEKGWQAAPMLASYENSVAAYTVSLRKRLSDMETWMMRQRVIEIESLVIRSAARLKKQIKSSFQTKDLASPGPIKILELFQKAYAEDKQMEVLGYLGGYSDPWPKDWDMRVDAMRVALTPKARGDYPWRLLASTDVVRVIVDEDIDEDEGLISMACLDPAWVGENRDIEGVHMVHLSFSKDQQGNWILGLPESLLFNDKDSFLESQGLDDDLLDHFTIGLRKAWPQRVAESFEEAEREVLSQLESGRLLELLRWVDFNGDLVDSREACVLAARDWWSIHAPGVFRSPVKLGQRIEGDWAVAVYDWFWLSKGERFEPKSMFFHRTSKGWVWVPGSVRNVDPKVGKIFLEWMKLELEPWRVSAIKKQMELVQSLGRLPMDKQVEDAEVRELAQKWNSALKKKGIRELFGLSARLDADGHLSHKVFRNLAYELSMAQRVKTEITGIYRAGKWAAAGFAHGEGEEKFFSMMLTVATKNGLKVLSEIDLISEGNRTREFLNQASFDRLKPFVSNEELEEVKGLFQEFEKSVRE